jgi:hypothetical protein
MALEVDDVLLGPDKALATGHLVSGRLARMCMLPRCAASVRCACGRPWWHAAITPCAAHPHPLVHNTCTHTHTSHAKVVTSLVGPLVTAGAGAVGSATHRLLPQPLEKLAASASHLLPAGLAAARVPITIHMRLGKSDAGAPVVTHMSLVFSLLSVLLPHVRLQPWQAQALAAAAPQARGLLLQAGAAAAVAGDVGTSVGASWRAATAMLQVRWCEVCAGACVCVLLRCALPPAAARHQRLQHALCLCRCPAGHAGPGAGRRQGAGAAHVVAQQRHGRTRRRGRGHGRRCWRCAARLMRMAVHVWRRC